MRRGGSPERSQASVPARRRLNYSWRLALHRSLRGIQTKEGSFFFPRTRAETANSPAELRIFTPTKLVFARFLADTREGDQADVFHRICWVLFSHLLPEDEANSHLIFAHFHHNAEFPFQPDTIALDSLEF